MSEVETVTMTLKRFLTMQDEILALKKDKSKALHLADSIAKTVEDYLDSKQYREIKLFGKLYQNDLDELAPLVKAVNYELNPDLREKAEREHDEMKAVFEKSREVERELMKQKCEGKLNADQEEEN